MLLLLLLILLLSLLLLLLLLLLFFWRRSSAGSDYEQWPRSHQAASQPFVARKTRFEQILQKFWLFSFPIFASFQVHSCSIVRCVSISSTYLGLSTYTEVSPPVDVSHYQIFTGLLQRDGPWDVIYFLMTNSFQTSISKGYFAKCIFPKYIFAKCNFAKCTQYTHLQDNFC